MGAHRSLERFDRPGSAPARPTKLAGPAAGRPRRPPPDLTRPLPPGCPELAARSALEDHDIRIAMALENLARQAETSARDARRAAARAFGEAARDVLPAIASARFGEEVAEVAAALLHEARAPAFALHLNAADRAAVERALGRRGGPAPIALTAAGDLAPGQIRLAWPDGGADLDRDRLVSAALERLDHDLGLCAPSMETEG